LTNYNTRVSSKQVDILASPDKTSSANTVINVMAKEIHVWTNTGNYQ